MLAESVQTGLDPFWWVKLLRFGGYGITPFLWTDSAIQPATFTRPLVALPLVRN